MGQLSSCRRLPAYDRDRPAGEAVQNPSNNSGSQSVAGRASTTSSNLLKLVQANDAESWRHIVGLYAPLVLWWCRRRGLGDQDAQDVVQEVFKTVVVKIKTFAKDGRPGAFRRWLYSITDFKMRDNWRRRRDEPPAPGGSSAQIQLAEVPAEDFEPDGVSARCLLVRRALELIRDKFEPRTWEVVWRVVVEGRYAQDVAAEFDMKIGAVHKAKSVVLRRLREALLEYEEFLT
jgi:RNA polymerase sigma-70 factor, ECF subfamily